MDYLVMYFSGINCHFKVQRNLLAVIVYLGMSSYSHAFNSQHYMTTLGLTSQPVGHYNYCKTTPKDCASNKGGVSLPVLTKKRWAQMVEVNHYANDSVTSITDMEQYNKEEYWTLPGKYGDCEDYVLLKRRLLIDYGWPASSLLVTVVKQPDGEGHAVLTVRTDRSDYVLDNLNDSVLPWNKTEYHYLKRQSTRHSGRWINIRDSRDIVGSVKRVQ